MEVVPTFNYTIKGRPELEKFFLFDLILHFRSFKICFVFRIKVILVHKILYCIFLSEKKLSILAKKTDPDFLVTGATFDDRRRG